MTNDEIRAEVLALDRRINELHRQNKLKERNKLAERRRKLYRAYDAGFEVGEEIETKAWGSIWRKCEVVHHYKDDNHYEVDIEDGRGMIVCWSFLRRIGEKEAGFVEQLELFG